MERHHTQPKPVLWAVLCLCAACAWGSPSRLKDIAVIEGQGRHKLVGYGLVAGLDGTGDSDTSLLTSRSMANLLQKLGLTVSPSEFKAKNLAAVMVTAELPPVAVVGATLDVTVSSLADAKSLQGGMLLLTPLQALDGEAYATAQGAITIGGFNASSSGGDKVQRNHVTVGRVPNGASVARALAVDHTTPERLSLLLLQPDFTTAVRVAEAINRQWQQTLAAALNQSTVQVAVPAEALGAQAEFIAALETLPIEPDAPARVVINERTGTIVMGHAVRIMPVAICHGGLTVQIKAEQQVSQPPPLVAGGEDKAPQPKSATGGRTAVVRQEQLQVKEAGGHLTALAEQATLQDLVTALDALGVKPRDLIAIIQALKEAGALQAELVLL
ncbi:MAG: flagellar basal body P-ring protein FlgI [Armatimonadota bacterium]